MKQIALGIFLLFSVVALSQSELPLSFKGVCVGTQTDIRDRSAVPDTPTVKCDSLTVIAQKDKTILSFSNGDPANPVLMFSGISEPVSPQKYFDPYLGTIGSAFPIDHVLWGDGTPAVAIEPAEHFDKFASRGCYLHFVGQRWADLSEVECELASETPEHRPRRLSITFTTEREFTVDQQKIAVIYGLHGASSFRTVFDGMQIDGTCGVRTYQVKGYLKHVEPDSPVEHLFGTVCYKDTDKAR